MCIHELFIPFCDRHDIHFTRKEYNFAFEVWFLNNKSFRENSGPHAIEFQWKIHLHFNFSWHFEHNLSL